MTSADLDRDTAPAVVGVDVGGTTIKARLFDGSAEVVGEWRVATPSGDLDASGTIRAVSEIVDAARRLRPVAAVGLAVPGVVDDEAGVAVASVNLGWRDLPLRDLLSSQIGLPVGFGQDVRAGALAESTTGAARDVPGGMAFVAIGTGLASAFVQGGTALVSGGWAGEIGQVVLRHGALAGLRVEDVASAGGLARRLGAANAREAAERVRAADPRAVAFWNDAVEVLADTLSWIAAVAAPEMIVVGGGLAEAGDLLFDPLRRALEERLAFSRRPTLARAAHGDAAAIVGAGVLARSALLP